MISYESKEEYKKISMYQLFFLILCFLVVTITCYYEVIGSTIKIPFVYDVVVFFRKSFRSTIVLKLVLLFFSVVTILVYTTGKVIDKERKKDFLNYGLLCVGVFLLLMLVESLIKVRAIFGFGLHTSSYLVGLYCLLQWKRQEAVDLKNDRRLEVEAQFEQQRELLDTKYSINIPYEYTYLGEDHTSWINVINPFRGSLVGGTPGSGKSYAIIDEFMRQEVSKGFAMAMYDFKYPTLTRKLYNYYWWYQDRYKVIPRFYVVNFEKPEYSNRCNPVNSDSLHTIADASENMRTLMYNINMNWKDQQGEFFTDSAMEYSTMLLWYLKLISKKYKYNICTFPHLVALSTFESTELMFFILQEYIDLKAKMKSFSEALEKGAMDQLAGQVASAGVALSKVTSKEINYIMSGDDFTFDINNPFLPKIVCLGNSPQLKETYSPVLGLMLSKLAKEMNKENRSPSGFIIDEFPSLYIRGVDNLIETGRSNKVATLLGFQSHAQITEGYGEITGKKMQNICGNHIMGQLMGEDAEKVSNSIGRQKVLQRSYNYSSNEVSENQQVNLESIVPPERISQFTQGVFCGIIADEFDKPEPNKVFYGKMKPPIELKNRENDIPLPQIRKFIEDDELNENAHQYIKDHSNLLERLCDTLSQKTINEWKIIFEKENTYEKFILFMMREFTYGYEIENVIEFLKLKDVFQDFMTEQLAKEERKHVLEEEKNQAYIELSKKPFSREILQEQMGKWVREAVMFDAREKYLTEYTTQIYNDVYRVVSLELLDLDIVTLLKSRENRQIKQRTIQLLNKILRKNKKFDESITLERFQKIIALLEEDEQEE